MKKEIPNLPQVLFKQHIFFSLTVAYFLFRLVNLTKLPIFNDEAIYLDWGWRMTHKPGQLFYSLYDAKQPLLMWLFGIAQSILPDPFFAGRFVSVLLGWLGMLGIYRLGNTYFSKKVGTLASLLYIVIPIFSFYDRQALMEAAIAAIGVWILWFALRFWKSGKTSNAVLVGILLGLGFFIKSSALIFLFAFFLLSLLMYWKKRSFQLKLLLISAATFFVVIFLLFLQPRFWETLSSNTRYGFGPLDLLRFPVISWITNALGDAEILLLFITPVVVFVGLFGLIRVFKNEKEQQKHIAAFFVIVIVLQILLVRSTSQRYLVSYFPPLVLFAAYATESAMQKYKHKVLSITLLSILFALPFAITLVQVIHPLSYFQLFTFSHFSEGGSYVTGKTSGYGVDEAIASIAKLPQGKRIFVGESLYTGNPESAILVWFAKSKRITVGYLDRRLMGDAINGIDCLKTDVPVYFVSKENDVAGMEKFLENVTYLKNPYNKNVIGIWKMKEKCEGKSLPVQLVDVN